MAAFALFSNLGGFSRREALILTAYLGLHPLVMFFGASVLSEMPFAFLALASMTVADRVTSRTARATGKCLLRCAGRTLGAYPDSGPPNIVGNFCYRPCAPFMAPACHVQLSTAPFVGIAAWNAIFSKKPASPITGPAGASLGWRHAWTFYTDYAGIWKLGVPNLHIFWAMLQNNAGMILRQPADLLLGPTFVRDTMLVRSLIRQLRLRRWPGL